MAKEEAESKIDQKMLVYYGLIIIAVVLLGIFLIFMILGNNNEKPKNSDDEMIQNSQYADYSENESFSCASEYQYDNHVNACTKVWELSMKERDAAKTAVEYVGEKIGLAVSSVKPFRCDGCYIVNISYKENVTSIIITEWKVHDVEEKLSINKCSLLSGKPVVTKIEGNCSENEISLGSITGFTTETICCVDIETGKISQDIIPHGQGDTCDFIKIICDDGFQRYDRNNSCGCERIVKEI